MKGWRVNIKEIWCEIAKQTSPSAEILNKMAAALAHFVHNGVQIILKTVWKFVKFLKYNNQELMVPSALDRDIFSTDSAIHQTSQGLDK